MSPVPVMRQRDVAVRALRPRRRRPGIGCASRSRGDSSSRITCPPSCSAASIAWCSCRLIAPRLQRSLTLGRADRSCRPPAAADRTPAAASRPADTRPAAARCQLSSDGVAEPSTSGTLSALARAMRHVAGVVARGRLLLERSFRALRPARSGPGAAWGRRSRCGRRRPPAPRPSAIRCQCQCRSASLRWLCSTATRAEPRAEALDGLRREADLRHQHDRLPAEARRPPGSPGCRPRSCRCR